MPRQSRRGRNRAPRSRRGGGSLHIGDEFLTFSIKVGGSANVTFGNLTTRPANCAIRPVFISIEAREGYVPGLANDSGDGWSVPSGFDIQMFDPSSKVVSVSRPRVLGAAPRRTFVRYPRSGDWFPHNAVSGDKIAVMTALCFGPASTGGRDAFVRGIIHVRYAFSFEVLTGACPTYQHLVSPEPPLGDSWWEHVEAVYPTQQLSSLDVRRSFSVLTESEDSVVIDIE